MSLVNGYVQQISQRGKATNMKVNGTWYGCGFDGVSCQVGDQIEFSVTQNGQYLNADAKSIRVMAPSNNAPAQQQSNEPYKKYNGPSKGKSGGGFQARKLDDPVQVSITQQSARNAAIATLQLAAQAEALPLPAKKADKFDALLGLVDQVTERYYKETLQVANDGGYKERAEAQQFEAGGSRDDVPVQHNAEGPAQDFDDDIAF